MSGMERSSRWSLLPALVLATAVACDGGGVDPGGIDREDVVGTYEATAIRSVVGGQTTDHLADGGSLGITLSGDGTTGGRLFLPDLDEDGGDFEADLTGSWTWNDGAGTVTLQHGADTFLRDMVFTAERDDGLVLVAEETFSSGRVEVVLRRQ